MTLNSIQCKQTTKELYQVFRYFLNLTTQRYDKHLELQIILAKTITLKLK